EVELEVQPGDRLYLLSDGTANQISRETGKPIGSKGVTEILSRIQSVPIHLQKEALIKEIETLRGDLPQNDDMIVVGMEMI
ncbi:MAG: serine/threonine-protein phosphatase, partial [Bacteroidia bacterium]|nr:serine/threonine-protein phosphatase [Bacteroidia bacterium]